MSKILYHLGNRKGIDFLIFFLALTFIIIILGVVWPPGPDYNFVFRPVAERFISGETRLYDEFSQGYFLSPWAVFLFTPTLLVTSPFGQAIISAISLLGVLFLVRIVMDDIHVPVAFLAFAVVNLHTVDLIFRGNIDGFLAFGLGLGWLGAKKRSPLVAGEEILILSIKPINILLPLLVLLLYFRKWSIRERIIVFLPTILTLLTSFYHPFLEQMLDLLGLKLYGEEK
jgi:hypothetical protein